MVLVNSEVNENITEFEEYTEDIRTMKGEITDELVKVGVKVGVGLLKTRKHKFKHKTC